MKFFSIFALLLFSAGICGAQTLTPSRLNFYKISASATRRVTLLNTGSTPMVIRAVKSDCNCTLITYSKKPILVGDSTVLHVTYTPAGDERGVFYKVVSVVLSSQKTPLEFALSGVVVAP